MSTVLFIFVHNIIPVFIVMAIGFIIAKNFDIQITSLTKLNFYAISPCFIFASLYPAEIPASMGLVVLFVIAFTALSWAVSFLVSRLLKFSKSEGSVLVNSMIFINAGNMGLPIMALVFAASPFLEHAMTVQISVLFVQSVTTQTLGFYISHSGSETSHWKESLKSVLKMPAIYAGLLVIIFKLIPIDLTTMFFWPSLEYIRATMIGFALMTFGVQLAKTEWRIDSYKVFVPVILRLGIGPLIALALILLFRFPAETSQVLLISATMPTAVNTALIAVETGNSPKFASQVVMVCTIMSLFALTAVIAISGSLFPVSM